MRDRLTAEADDDDAVDIRVAGKARQHLLAHRRIGRHIRAARVEDDVDRAAHLARHDAAALTAAGTRRQDQDVVADARPPLRTAIAPERERREVRRTGRLLRLHHEIITRELALIVARHALEVLVIDPVALLDRRDELAEALAVLDDLRPLCEVSKCDLVAVGDVLLCHKRHFRCALLIDDILPALHFLDTRHDIVARIHL